MSNKYCNTNIYLNPSFYFFWICTVGYWTTWIWTVQVHIHVCVCVCVCVCFPLNTYYVCMYACLVTQSWQLFATPWMVVHQTSLSMELSRQGYWNGLPFLLQRISPLRDRTWVSHIPGRFITVWANRTPTTKILRFK